MTVSGAKRTTLATLLPALEKAERGSARFDLLLAYLFDTASPADLRRIELFREDGYLPERIADLLGFVPLPYTTSLDAALPGENIVLSMYSAARGCWVAIQRRPDGEEVMCDGATEALARRIAALRSIAAGSDTGQSPAAWGDGVVPQQHDQGNIADDCRPGGEPTGSAGDSEAKPWKILF